MTILRIRLLCLVALGFVTLPTLAVTQDQPDPGEKAISARQGFMQVVVWEAGPLFAMAKGDIAYDADAAAAHAANLNSVVQYDVDRLFLPETSKSDRPDETRALAAIWEKPDEFAQAYSNLREKTAVAAEEAGKGQEAMTAAVSELGKACGNCHDNFRAEDF